MSNSKLSYIEKPEDGVTVALLGANGNSVSGDVLYLISRFTEKYSKYLNFDWFGSHAADLMLSEKFKGVARCDFRYDDYDAETGKAIARKKCLDKYNSALDAGMIEFLKDILNLESEVVRWLYNRGAIILEDNENGEV